MRRAIERGELPQRHGSIPIIITLHDLNPVTALRMTDYLHILVEEAGRAGLPLADKPFYDNAAEIIEVASLRAAPPKSMLVTAPATGTDSSTQTDSVPVALLDEEATPSGQTHPESDHPTTVLR
jgi:hypothetical protein